MNFIGMSAKKCEKSTFYLLIDLRVNFNKFSYTYFVKYWNFQNLPQTCLTLKCLPQIEVGLRQVLQNCYFNDILNKMIHILIKIGKCV